MTMTINHSIYLVYTLLIAYEIIFINLKDVPGGFPKSDLLGVTVALIHVAEAIGLMVVK